MRHPISFVVASVLLFCATSRGDVPTRTFVNFEARQTNPVRLSPNGQQLFAVNSADARLSVFDTGHTPPRLAKEIPVGIEPVSVNAFTDDEVWVVNELSDSISIVSISRGIVTDTISVKDEPADVVFAAGLAFVSASGNNELRVYDASTHALIKIIGLAGQRPRAMAVNGDASKVFVAFAESGNRTTIIPRAIASPQPSVAKPHLPPAPDVGLIVDAADPQWSPSVIKFTIPDNDVAEIDVATLTVSRYFSRVGTSNLGIAVQPGSGDLFVVNTDARNHVRFEPNLRGRFVDNRITRIPIGGGAFVIADLNPEADVSPNPEAHAIALAQPTSIVFDPDGSFSYVAAFGSDRVARLNDDGEIVSRIAIRGDDDSRNMRGPRGLAFDAAAARLYVLNRISNSISVVDTTLDTVIAEVPVGTFDPTPRVIRNGRGFLYDARLSGNGTVSCASCHVDGNTDRLAWDLGDPGGEMRNVSATVSSRRDRGEFEMHPMKGPMTTQTLKGLRGEKPLHWRGDHDDFTAFNAAFHSLLGGSEIPAVDMAAFRAFAETLTFPPNPNQQLDRTLPPTVAGGDPAAGLNSFVNEEYAPGLTCNSCHVAAPGTGGSSTLTASGLLQDSQHFKVPHLRNMYQKAFFDNTPGARSLDGFGFTHDGAESTIFGLLGREVFPNIRHDAMRKANLNAFLMCFDTGTAPAVGFTRTISAATVDSGDASHDWALLESQARTGNIEVIAKGTVDGELRGLVYQPAHGSYRTDRLGVGPFTREELVAKIAAGDTLSVMGVPPGSGVRMGIDRDLNGTLDSDHFVAPAAGPQRLVNISTRVHAGTGDNVLVAGFIIDGAGQKKVLLRGTGPSIGIGHVLADPMLELHTPDGRVIANDNWRDEQEEEISSTTVPPAHGAEPAIIATLDPGAYTVVLRGKHQTSGIGLVEVYDLDSHAGARLANISSRGVVQNADDVMIGGLIVQGDAPSYVLLRATGPSLGVADALQNPLLELYDAHGNVAGNDDWQAEQEAEIAATTVPPTSEREAAIVMPLSAGVYTAVIRGTGGSTGIALLEAYHLAE